MMEAKVILTTLIRRCSIEVANPGDVQPDPGITLRPDGGMHARVRPLDSP